MKELLKKASLTVASACLIAGGLVAVGWAGHHAGESKSERLRAMSFASAENTEKQQAMPDELEVNGVKYKKVRIQCVNLTPEALASGLDCVK